MRHTVPNSGENNHKNTKNVDVGKKSRIGSAF